MLVGYGGQFLGATVEHLLRHSFVGVGGVGIDGAERGQDAFGQGELATATGGQVGQGGGVQDQDGFGGMFGARGG